MYKYSNNNIIASCEQTFDSFCGALTRFTQNTFGFTEYEIINLDLNKTIANNFKKGEK